jgi:DNA-binding transcriptional ArsR family regulator
MARQEDELARLLKVLSVGTRVKIVQVLKGRALCVGALAAQLNVTQGAVSQHLRVMRDTGLVIDEKRGYYVHYRLNEQTLARWQRQIDSLLAPGPAGKCRCPKRSDEKCEGRLSTWKHLKGDKKHVLLQEEERLPKTGEP